MAKSKRVNFSKQNPILYLIILGLICWSIFNFSVLPDRMINTNALMPSIHPMLMMSLGAFLAFGFCIVLFFSFGRKKEFANKTLGNEETTENAKIINSQDYRQKLLALDLMLKGEEEERRRISQDIHEGLGNLLSSILFNINAKQGIDEQEVIRQSSTMIDQAIGETRRIAYYVMPGTLMALGLIPAVEDLCRSYDNEFKIKTYFQSFGIEERLEPALEYAVYRLVQGALNNIVKFAKASEALVQITRENYTLNVIIEDDGTGFDIDAYGPLSETYSYKAMYARISYLDGKLAIESNEGKGTNLIIEIPIR